MTWRLIPLRAADRLELLGDLLREPGDVPAEREDDHAHVYKRLQGRPVLGLPSNGESPPYHSPTMLHFPLRADRCSAPSTARLDAGSRSRS